MSATSFLRYCAATLICLSGTFLIGALWYRELTTTALTDALIGATYLFIGIGLFGRSSFTLWLAVVIPAASFVMLANTLETTTPPQQLRMITDIVIVLCSGWVLWRALRYPDNET